MSGGPWEDFARTAAPAPSAPPAAAPEGPWQDFAPKAAPEPYQPRTFTLSNILKGVYNAAVSGATLPRDVYEGKVDPLSDEAIRRSVDLAGLASPITPASRVALAAPAAAPAAGAVRDAADLGVTLTAGQRTGDPVLLSTENTMLGGGKGATAQRVAQEAAETQRGQLSEAKAAIGDAAGRGQADLARSADAGDAVSLGVKQAASEAKQGYQAKYADAFAQPGELDPRFFTGAATPGAGELTVPGSAMADIAAPLSRRITESLVNRAEPVIVDQTLTPAAHRALSELDSVSNLQLGSIGQPEAGQEIVGVSLRGVDQARRKLASYARAAVGNPADQRAVGQIIGEFDAQVQSAMENGLFSGSEQALNALREARSAFASYQRTFKPRGSGDDVGRALGAILERDATPEQVANYLYGSAKIGGTGLSVRLTDRLKGILGEESPEWGALRQGAWQRVLGAPDTGAKRSADRILDFVDGEGKSLSTRLFSEAERGEMRKLANVLRAVTTKPGTGNPSNSGNRLGALARESFSAIASMLGASTGGVPGAAAGYVAGRGTQAISDARAASQARQLFSGREPVTIGARLRSAASGSGGFAAPRLSATGTPLALPPGVQFPRLQGPVPGYAGEEQR